METGNRLLEISVRCRASVLLFTLEVNWTVEARWARLCSCSVDVESPAWHEEVLADRTKRLESGEATVSEWIEAKKRLQNLGQ